ncbi:MAG TPA: alpha-L-rhamnosidase N-terminal domain-containing protein [Conexibacter sp.]|nr:alpha-L-rhamnosidase N-terminal domain-containing protein [Conexibacter sp.]
MAVSAGCVLAAGGAGAATAAADVPAPSQLTVRDQQRPLNVEGPPQFGWMPGSERGDDVQSAYQLRVQRAGDDDPVWDSGKVDSDAQSYVRYEGPRLAVGASYEWTVRTWDGDGDASGWAPKASFDTGLRDGDWSGAKWIRRITTGNDSAIDFTLARKQVQVGGSPVVRARAYVSAMGQYELHVNGRRVVRDSSFYYPNEAQYTATDVTAQVTAGQPLALAARYHYWTCTCQGRANGPASNTTLAAAAAPGDTTLRVASVGVFDVGDQVDVGSGADRERVTVTAIGTAGAAGTGVTVTPALTRAQAERAAVVDLAGPSGLIAKVVVDHADGSRQTFVTDESWRVSKDRAFTNETLTYRNGDAGDRVERYDARLEQPGWDTVGFDDSGWEPAYAIGAHPRPVNPLRTTFTHLEPSIAGVTRKIHRPVSVRELADGTVIADMGRVVAGVPRVRFREGVAGRQITLLSSFRLNNTLLAAPAAAGDATVKVRAVGNFVAGDRLTVDAPGINKGEGDPEVRTIVSVGTAGAEGTGIVLDRPLERAHANLAYVEGSRAGTDGQDTQSSNLANYYTQKDGAQTAEPYQYWGWRYLQVSAPGAGEPLTANDLVAVEQFTDDREERLATFDSDDATLNAVFELMRRSGRDSVQDTYLDTPTREKAGFLGDGVDISWANMLALGERNATVRGIRDAIHSQTHSWTAPSNGYCTALEVPCSYPSLGTPGRMNSVYPNGDNMRDIPDYTEMFPDWVWRYYLTTGDRALLEEAYPAMQAVSAYVNGAVASSGDAAGLVFDLPGGTSSYRNGIIDWPAPMRYGYTFDDNAARTVHNASGVGAIRATAEAAKVLGRGGEAAQYGQWADALTSAINGKLVRPSGLYTDGLSRQPGNAQIDNSAQHAQSYPIYYGVAPRAQWPALADEIERLGMNQGPMTLHILLDALARAGRDDAVLRLLTDRAGDGPARTVAEGGTFMWEQWSPGCTTPRCAEPNVRSSDSHSHGWGSWAIVDVVETLLGVKVTSPGAATVAIEPPTLRGDRLRTASGSVWTQRGTVAVRWARGERGLTLDVKVPTNQRAEVRIPGVTDAAAVTASGAGAPRLQRIEDGAAVFTVGSGDARFEPAAATPPPGPPTPPPGGGTTPPTPPAPPARRAPARRDRVKPRVTAVKLAGGQRIRVRGTLALRLRLSERATVRVALQRAVRGRWRAAGGVSKTLAAGSRTLKVKLGKRPAGTYRLTLVARDRAGNRSVARTVRFAVVRARG